MSEGNQSARSVGLVIDPKGLEESIHALLTKKYDSLDHISLPPIKFKAVFKSKESADQARAITTPLKVTAICQLKVAPKKARVVHFPSPWDLKEYAGDKWKELSLEIAQAFESLPGGRPLNVRSSMGNIVLTYGTDEDRAKILNASGVKDFSLTIKGEEVTKITAGYPFKTTTKREDQKKRKAEARKKRRDKKKPDH